MTSNFPATRSRREASTGSVGPRRGNSSTTGRFGDNFVEERRNDLERYVNRVVRRPVVRYTEVPTLSLAVKVMW